LGSCRELAGTASCAKAEAFRERGRWLERAEFLDCAMMPYRATPSSSSSSSSSPGFPAADQVECRAIAAKLKQAHQKGIESLAIGGADNGGSVAGFGARRQLAAGGEGGSPLERAAVEVGRAEQLLLNRQCFRPSARGGGGGGGGRGSVKRYEEGGARAERSCHCVPDMRFFASALHGAFNEEGTEQAESSSNRTQRPSEAQNFEEHWRGVRAYKLTAT
jgi:hypothetical protein